MNLNEFENFIEDNQKDIYTFCKKLAINEEYAKDLYQQTFLKAFSMIESIDKMNNPKSFLLSISVGLWKNYKRKHKRRGEIAPLVYIDDETTCDVKDSFDTEQKVIENETIECVKREVSKLPDKYKVVIILFYNQELGIEEISKVIKCPCGTVKSRLNKARQLLRSRLEEYV